MFNVKTTASKNPFDIDDVNTLLYSNEFFCNVCGDISLLDDIGTKKETCDCCEDKIVADVKKYIKKYRKYIK
jgi:hypothetical protein